MIYCELLQDKGVLVLGLQGPLEAADFNAITSRVNTYLERHGKLHGVVIRANAFPGRGDFGAMLANLKSLKDQIRKIEKVAVVADGALANIVPEMANHFVSAQARHFECKCGGEAWDWINQAGIAQTSGELQ